MHWESCFVNDIIHRSAERVEGGHSLALLFWQADEGKG
jgi:hypothetical protein